MGKYEELYKCEYRKSHGIIGKNADGWYILAGSVIAQAPTNSFEAREKAEIKNLKSRRLPDDMAVSSKTMAVSVLGRHGVDRLTADRYTGNPVDESEAEAYLKEEVNTDISPENNAVPAEKEDKFEAMGEYLDKVDALIGDERFLKLEYLHNKNNIFKILGQTHTEHWHSSFFKWLLDPNSTLGLGAFPLERFIFMCLSKMNHENKLLDINHFFEKVLNLSELEFETEHNVGIYDGKHYGWKKGSIDIYAANENFELIIENKVTAKEEIKARLSSSDYAGPAVWGQTDMYYDSISKSNAEKGGEKKDYLFVFLTPDANMAPNCHRFVHITYQDMYDHVIKKCIAHPEIEAEQKFILEDYANNLSEPYKISEKNSDKYVLHPMALTNIPLCEELYKAHTDILVDIYEAADVNGSGGNAVTKLLYEVYRAHSNEFNEIYLSVENFDGTPSSIGKMRSNRISFTSLCREGKIHDGEIIYLVSDGKKLYAQFYMLEGECYLRLLNSDKKPIEGYDEYTQKITSLSTAADYAIRLSRGNPDEQKKISINGRDAWKAEGSDQSAQEWYI